MTYLKNNRITILVAAVAVLLLRGIMMLLPSIGIDTEALINNGKDFYQSWTGIGRQGLVLLAFLLGNYEEFHLLASGIGAMIFLFTTVIAWNYLYVEVSGKDIQINNILFVLILSASTIFTEQMYFKLQAMEVFLSFTLTAISLLLVYKFCEKGKKLFLPLAVVICVIDFSVYQVLTAIFIFGSAACVLLYKTFKKGEEGWKLTWSFVGVFFAGFVINSIITKLFFSRSGYLSNQMHWGVEPVINCVINIAKHVFRVCTGYGVFYPISYSLYLIFFIVYFIKHKADFLTILSALLVAISPFLLTIVMGFTPVYRAQLVLPFTVSFLAFLSLSIIDAKKLKQYIYIYWQSQLLYSREYLQPA